MKFSHSLQLNASPEWREHYIDYSKLKKSIYILEKATLGLARMPANVADLDNDITETPAISNREQNSDQTPLLTANGEYPQAAMEDVNKFFKKLLDEQLEKIIKFYNKTEARLLKELQDLTFDITKAERQEESYLHSLWNQRQEASNGVLGASNNQYGSANLDSAEVQSRSISPEPHVQVDIEVPLPGFLPYLIWSSSSLKAQRRTLTSRGVRLFVLFSDLRDFIQINETGFGKVLKKYEKVTGGILKSEYMEMVSERLPFTHSHKDVLESAIERITLWYARIATDGKLKSAEMELKAHLREHVVWERNTIWLDMVEAERRTETIGFRPQGAANSSPKFTKIIICGFNCYFPTEIPSNLVMFFVASFLLIYLSNAGIFATAAQNNCVAILAFASIMWAFEVVPLFVTSMMIPALIVSMRVMVVNGVRLNAKDGAKLIFSDMFGPVIMLLLGGFSLAAALSKHHIAKSVASEILEKAGTKPATVLLANMFVSTFASMWISNVAAPVLCFSLISPILRNLPHRSKYARCLVIGIAMAANVGGMASPIASPQNVIAMGIMNPPPSWLQWFIIALPLCIVLDLAIWATLLLIYRPSDESVAPHELFSNRRESFNMKQYYIIGVTAITIILWCLENTLESVVGDMGIIAIFPMVAFFGFGILTKDDWNSMLWSVVMLAMGGIALGKAVESCGLLNILAEGLLPILQNYSVFACVAILSGIIVIITSFVSHTVGALIILPVIAKIGDILPDPHPRTLVMAATLMCSGGMGLPVSSFPNMNAISLEDSRGVPWLRVQDFMVVGVLSSGFAWLFSITLGYTIMTLLDFH